MSHDSVTGESNVQVIVRELGSKPTIMTPARLNAPQGARALADIMAEEDYADLATISVDWKGDGITPVLSILTVKFFPEYAPENLQHFWPIDMEDAFGSDEKMNRDTLLDINEQLKALFNESTAIRKRLESQGNWHRPGEVKYIDANG